MCVKGACKALRWFLLLLFSRSAVCVAVVGSRLVGECGTGRGSAAPAPGQFLHPHPRVPEGQRLAPCLPQILVEKQHEYLELEYLP